MKEKSKQKNSGIFFEIDFFEKLIAGNPDFVDALIPLAEAYTKAGFYEKGLEIDRRLAQLRSSDPVVHYNLACSYSLLNIIDEAAQALKRAVVLGYDDVRHMETDADLSNLRKDERYQKIISKIARIKKG